MFVYFSSIHWTAVKGFLHLWFKCITASLRVLLVVVIMEIYSDFDEQIMVMKFLVKAETTNSEIMEMMRSVYGDCFMKRSSFVK